MKTYYYFLALVLFLSACSSDETATEDTNEASEPVVRKQEPAADTMLRKDTLAKPAVPKAKQAQKAKPKTRQKNKVEFVPPVVVEMEEPVGKPDFGADETLIGTDPKPEILLPGPLEEDADAVYEFVEELPTFKGDFHKYLIDNLKYPPSAQENNLQGKVFVRFVVTKEGSVKDPVIFRGIKGGDELNAEALRVVKAMSPCSWNPGKQNGEAVNCWMTVPVKFELGQ